MLTSVRAGVNVETDITHDDRAFDAIGKDSQRDYV
jgi:hypothetical protein